jgi:putative copper export protein
MNIVRDAAGVLFKMFVGDAWLAVGVLSVVSLTGLLTESGAVPPLFGGAILFFGCIAVLLASVAFHGRRHRDR